MSEEVVKAGAALAVPSGAVLSAERLVAAMARWSIAYRQPATIDVLSVYYDALSDFRDDDAEAGMRECVRREEYPAPPATVRKYCASARYARLDREEDARERAEYAEWKRSRPAALAALALRDATIASWTSGPTTSPAEAIERLSVRGWERPSLQSVVSVVATSSGALHLSPRNADVHAFFLSHAKDIEQVVAREFAGPVVVQGAEA